MEKKMKVFVDCQTCGWSADPFEAENLTEMDLKVEDIYESHSKKHTAREPEAKLRVRYTINEDFIEETSTPFEDIYRYHSEKGGLVMFEELRASRSEVMKMWEAVVRELRKPAGVEAIEASRLSFARCRELGQTLSGILKKFAGEEEVYVILKAIMLRMEKTYNYRLKNERDARFVAMLADKIVPGKHIENLNFHIVLPFPDKVEKPREENGMYA